MKTIDVNVTNSSAGTVFQPANANAETFCALKQSARLTPLELAMIKRLGFKIRILNERRKEERDESRSKKAQGCLF